METHFYSKIELLRDFMLQSSRPVEELNVFLRAYDECTELIMSQTKRDNYKVYPEPIHKDNVPEDGVLPLANQVEPAPKRKVVRRVRYTQIIHSGTTPNIHPRAKIVMAEFPGREPEFFGSMKAAAEYLNCSEHAISNAIVSKKELNGYMLKNITMADYRDINKAEDVEP